MRIKLFIAAIAALILATTGVTLASASGDGSSGSITVFSTQDQFAFLDLDQSGGKAATLGDQIVFTDKLLDREGGSEVGTDAVVCTAVRVSSTTETDQCVATFSLTDRGQITVQALVDLPTTGDETGAKFDLSVTGGSGEFDGAGGHVTVEILNKQGDANLTFHLLG